jgi:hypothetical protein
VWFKGESSAKAAGMSVTLAARATALERNIRGRIVFIGFSMGLLLGFGIRR